MNFEELTISWVALKMTFAMIPGICFVSWMAQTGWMRKDLKVNDLIDTYSDVNNAKREGIWEFSQIILPLFPTVVYILLIIILFLIPYDTILITVFNFSALPAGIFAYYKGRNAGRYRRENQGRKDYDPSLVEVIKIMVVWFATAIPILIFLNILDYWKPN